MLLFVTTLILLYPFSFNYTNFLEQSQSSLPKPVMYVDPSKLINPNDEDRYTNSELFSNPGSHEDQLEILRDDARPAPDWMSDSSENFIPAKLPPPRPTRGGVKNGVAFDQLAGLENLLNTAPAGLLQQVSLLHFVYII